MKRIILLYLVLLLGFADLKEDIRNFFNKSYKEYYKLEFSNEDLLELKLDLNLKDVDYGFNDIRCRDNTEMLVIHHCARKIWSPEDVNNFHKGRGWDGIGYNFYIRKDGNIYNGRGEDAVGAQLKGYNNISIGICLEGNFQEEEINEEQLEALNKLIFYCVAKYDVKKIVGHKEYGETLCPGKNINIKSIKRTLINNLKKSDYREDLYSSKAKAS